jgi:hypothetical protein
VTSQQNEAERNHGDLEGLLKIARLIETFQLPTSKRAEAQNTRARIERDQEESRGSW